MTDIAARTERTLSSLKDFQRATVDYAFERLWLADDPVKKFLVADEVGLGKTMVAKDSSPKPSSTSGKPRSGSMSSTYAPTARSRART